MKFSRSPHDELVPRRRQTVDSEAPSLSEQSSYFRRNQTLSGHRRTEEGTTSHRHRLHHLSGKRRRVGGIFFLVLSIIIVLTIVLTQFVAQLSITSASTSIARPVDTARYETTINEYLGVHPVERLRFVLNRPALLLYVQQSHPEVADIGLSDISDIVKAHFSITFREPIAGWQINNRQNYVDDQGVVFEENYFDAPTVQIVDDSGISPQQGSAVASSRLLSFVGRAAHEAGERGYNVQSVTLPSDTTRQLEIRFKDVGPVIRVSIDRGAGEQIEDADRSLRYLQSVNRGVTYIDVRTAGQAVYR